MYKIIVATNNSNKFKEYKDMFKELDISLLSLKDIGFSEEIEENGTSFSENSYIKAKTIFDIYHIPVIADDSGLEVKILNNAPSIHSHRYAHDKATDRENIDKLLKELSVFPSDSFDARFVCSITYIDRNKVINKEGYLEGKIIKEIRGKNGFGYDPIFYLEEYNKTVSELDEDIKNTISHRYKALKKLIEVL